MWLVWLLCACGVRRIKDLRRVCLYFIRFSLFVLAFVLVSLCLLCFACPLACLVYLCYPCGFLCVLLFPFPLRYMCKKKGRKGFAPCVLSSFVVSVQNLVQLSKNSLAVYLAFSSSVILRVQFLTIPVSGQSRSGIYHLVALRLFPPDIYLPKLPPLCQVVRLSGFLHFLSRCPKNQNCDLTGLFHCIFSLLCNFIV